MFGVNFGFACNIEAAAPATSGDATRGTTERHLFAGCSCADAIVQSRILLQEDSLRFREKQVCFPARPGRLDQIVFSASLR
jgi:hypothetical protein